MAHSIIPADEKIRHFKRIVILEKFIMIPAKLIVVIASAIFLWQVKGETEFKFVFYRYQFWMYLLGNLVFIFTLIKLGQRKVNFKIVKLSAFFLSVIDNLFLSFLIYFSNGLDSEFYWLYCGLMIRNAVNFPKIRSQSALNLSFIMFYVIAIYLHDQSSVFLHNQVFWLKVAVLVLVGICCWGIYTLLSRKTRVKEELQEMTLRAEKISLAGKLAASIAHELKNPFGIIINSVYILENSIGNTSPENRKHLDIVRKEILRSDRIITDLLNYSRLVEGKVEKIDVNQSIDAVVNDMGPEFFKNIKIERKYSPDLPRIYFDSLHMKQIIYNIVTNARQAMEEKGEIVIETAYSSDGYILVVVQDTGRGIDPGLIGKVFDPFVTTKKKGTGLGLSVVKSIVDTYGGSVNIKSSGAGTEVKVNLPIRTILKNGNQ